MFVVGHLMVGGVLFVEQTMRPAFWVQVAIWIPLSIALSLYLLPRIKGALVGLQWALRMHGFSGTSHDDMTLSADASFHGVEPVIPDRPQQRR